MITIIIQYVLSPVVVAMCGYIVHLLKESKKITDANAKGTMLLLRRQIIRAYDEHVTNKEPMSAFEFDDLKEIHDAYKGLDGNGLTDKMWEEIGKVQIIN